MKPLSLPLTKIGREADSLFFESKDFVMSSKCSGENVKAYASAPNTFRIKSIVTESFSTGQICRIADARPTSDVSRSSKKPRLRTFQVEEYKSKEDL